MTRSLAKFHSFHFCLLYSTLIKIHTYGQSLKVEGEGEKGKKKKKIRKEEEKKNKKKEKKFIAVQATSTAEGTREFVLTPSG